MGSRVRTIPNVVGEQVIGLSLQNLEKMGCLLKAVMWRDMIKDLATEIHRSLKMTQSITRVCNITGIRQ